MVKNIKMRESNMLQKKQLFEAEIQHNGKILLRSINNKDLALVTSPQALGLFIRKNLGLNQNEEKKE